MNGDSFCEWRNFGMNVDRFLRMAIVWYGQ